MNFKSFIIIIIILISLGMTVSSKELVFKQNYCVVGNDCILNNLLLTGNFSFIGFIFNVTILNQNITGQLDISGGLNVNGNITADYYFGDGSLLILSPSLWKLSNFTKAYDERTDRFGKENETIGTTLWNSSNTEVYLNDSTKSLRIENITSPFVNKSYITFFDDGSVGITLDPVPDTPSVSVQEGPKSVQGIETKEYTRGTERTCKDGMCNLVLYSGTRFAEQDNTWVDVRDARSLKGIYKIKYLKNDGVHDFEIVDLNYTSITLKVFVKDSKELNKDIPFKVDDVQKTTKKLISLEDKPIVTFKSDNILANNYSFGSKSTTIILQDADTENLEDTFVRVDSPTSNGGSSTTLIIESGSNPRKIYIKFNISDIPLGQQIDSATLYLWKHFGSGEQNMNNITVHHVFNQSWTEDIVIWNDQPCGTDFDDTNICNLVWEDSEEQLIFVDNYHETFSVTLAVGVDYNAGNSNVSFILNTTGGTSQISFRSKEYATVADRPYLNITYSALPETQITTTLTSPTDGSIELNGDITFNCSATPERSNVTNISLYHNATGNFIEIENNELNGSFETTVATGFEITGITNNTFLAWNCLSFNNATNSSFASSNFTFTVLFPDEGIKNPKLFVQNLSSIIMWYVDSIGDMFLRNNLDVNGNTDIEKNLTVDTDTLFVDSTNNLVGIGTTNPGVKLDVNGNVTIRGNLTVLGENTTVQDLTVIGTIHGGSPVKIAGINITENVFSLTENKNQSSKFTLTNLNKGTNASAVISAINNLGASMSIGILSSTFRLDTTDYANATALLSRSRGKMIFANFYNQDFLWLTNPSNDNNPANLVEVMNLNASGVTIQNNLTIIERLILPNIIQLPASQSTFIVRDDTSGVVGTKFGVRNTVASTDTDSGVSYILDVGSRNNMSLDLHSSLDLNNPLTVVSHYNNDVKGHVWRLNPDNDNAFFAWEVGKGNRVMTINKTGEITFNNSMIITEEGTVNFTNTLNNVTIQGDLKIIGTSYGGSTFKIGGGLNVSGGFGVSELNAGSCDLKADTVGNFYCGTDADSGGSPDTTDYWKVENATKNICGMNSTNITCEGGKLVINQSFLTSYIETDPIASTYKINRTDDEIGDISNSSLLNWIIAVNDSQTAYNEELNNTQRLWVLAFNYIDNTVSNLVNYFTKTEIFGYFETNKSEIINNGTLAQNNTMLFQKISNATHSDSTSLVSCEDITGSPDTDFCTDATGSGASVGNTKTQFVTNANCPTSWTDLDLSGTVGTKAALVHLSIESTAGDMNSISVRANGDGSEYHERTNEVSAYGIAVAHHDSGGSAPRVVLSTFTDSSGVVEWICETQRTSDVYLLGWVS